MIYHIVASANNGVIGNKNELPWHFSEDLKQFKLLTTGHTVIMGRKTFESIGKPLPNRPNFILSRSEQKIPSEGVRYFTSISDALSASETEHTFIIGGGELFKQTFDLIDGIYISKIDRDYEGDAVYPDIPEGFALKEEKTLRDSDPRITLQYFEKS